jgi:hypothetical protein
MLHFARSGLCLTVALLAWVVPATVDAQIGAHEQAAKRPAGTKLVPLWALLAVDPAVAQAPAAPVDAPASSPTPAGDSDDPPPADDPGPVLDAEADKKAVPVPEEERSVFKTWWFWALTAAIVGGTVALGVAAADTVDPTARNCAPTVSACFGDGREGSR